MNWDDLREEYCGQLSHTYLNNAANGLVSPRCVAYAQKETEAFMKDPNSYRMHFIFNEVPQIKTLIADSLKVKAHQIALVPNFSLGLNILLPSLELKHVGLVKGDYPSLTMPFELSGKTISWLSAADGRLDHETLDRFLTEEKPQLLAISQTQWLSGYTIALDRTAALCKKHGVKLLVDGTQSYGATPIDLSSGLVDIYIASCYKWILAGFGNGFMCLSERLLETLTPKVAGFNSMTFDHGSINYISGAKSFEPGHQDHDAFNRLKFAVKEYLGVGPQKIKARINELMDYLVAELHRIHIRINGEFSPEERLGILSFEGDHQLFKYLQNKGIEVAERGGFLRVGLHFYSSKQDVDVLIEALSAYRP